MQIINIKSKKEFNDFISDSNETVKCVKFGAIWCNPCKTLDNAIERAYEEQVLNCDIGIVDVEDDDLVEIVEEMGIMNIPVISFFKNGTEVDRLVGLSTIEAINNKLVELNS